MIAVVYLRKPCTWYPLVDTVAEVEILGTTLLKDTLGWLAHWGVGKAALIPASEGSSTSTANVPHLELVDPAKLGNSTEPLVAIDCSALCRVDLRRGFDALSASKADLLAVLSPTATDSGLPTALAAPDGTLREMERGDEENKRTNLSLTGIVTATDEASARILDDPFAFDPFEPVTLFDPREIAVETTGGYYRSLASPQSLLLCCYDALSGMATPWFGDPIPPNGTLVHESATILSALEGRCWIGRGARIGTDCCIDSCVILEDAFVGEGCSLRHTLVMPGARVRPGTRAEDKYLSVFV